MEQVIHSIPMSFTRSIVALLLVLGSLLNLLLVAHHFFIPHGSLNTYSWRGHDFPEFLPLHNSSKTLYHSDPVLLRVEESTHYPIRGNTSDDLWFSLTSAGWGYTHLGPEDRNFMVTVFHELHCLRVLNFAIGDSINLGHVHHCLNYLRQATLCSADLTLEPGDFTLKNFETDRVGALHTCKDWSMAYDIMQERWDHWVQFGQRASE